MNDINNIINDILNAMSFIIEQLCHKADSLLVEIYRFVKLMSFAKVTDF